MVRGASSSGRRTWAPCSSSMDSSTKASPSKAHLIVRDTSTAQDVPETDPLIPPESLHRRSQLPAPRDRQCHAACAYAALGGGDHHDRDRQGTVRSGQLQAPVRVLDRIDQPIRCLGLCSRMSPDGRCTCVVPQDQPTCPFTTGDCGTESCRSVRMTAIRNRPQSQARVRSPRAIQCPLGLVAGGRLPARAAPDRPAAVSPVCEKHAKRVPGGVSRVAPAPGSGRSPSTPPPSPC